MTKTLKDTSKSGVGNTNSTPESKIVNVLEAKEHRCMFFTLNNYNSNDIKTLETYFKGRKIYYMFSKKKLVRMVRHIFKAVLNLNLL